MEQTSPNTELHTSPIYGNKRFLILILCKCFGDDVNLLINLPGGKKY